MCLTVSLFDIFLQDLLDVYIFTYLFIFKKEKIRRLLFLIFFSINLIKLMAYVYKINVAHTYTFGYKIHNIMCLTCICMHSRKEEEKNIYTKCASLYSYIQKKKIYEYTRGRCV